MFFAHMLSVTKFDSVGGCNGVPSCVYKCAGGVGVSVGGWV